MSNQSNNQPSLDEILDNLTFQVLKWNYGASSAETKAEQHKVKRAIATAMNDVIGEDMPVPTGPRSAGKTYAVFGNKLKAEQRQRLNKYLGELK